MSQQQLHVVNDTADPVIIKHWHDVVRLVRQGVSAERKLYEESANYDPDLAFPEVKKESQIGAEVASFLGNGGVGVFHIEGETLAGIGFAYPISELKCMIGPLVVDEAYQRRGICKGMVHELENQMRAKGMKASVLIVLEQNPIKEFYHNHGYGSESLVLGREL